MSHCWGPPQVPLGCSSMECVALTFDGPRTQETKLNSLQCGVVKIPPRVPQSMAPLPAVDPEAIVGEAAFGSTLMSSKLWERQAEGGV